MSSEAITLLVSFGLASMIGAAVMHAIVAAFEQLPHARERVMGEAQRADGRPTQAAKLARDTDEVANAASVVYASLEAVALVSWSVLAWTWGRDLGWPGWVAALVTMALAAAYSLLLVRAAPRVIARAHPETTVRVLAPIGVALISLSTPVRAIIPALRMPALSEAEDLVEQAQDALEDEDAELLRGVVNLGDTLAREVMVPRTDMVTIASGTPLRKAMLLFMRSGFSRVPVIGDNTDDVRGLLYLKDVVRATWDRQEALDTPVDDLMREPVFLPESIPADDLLRRMQDEVFHMAIVIDEFGGVAGLVTIEDALEEIVGELTDEHDRAEPQVIDLGGGRFRVPARLAIDELGELFDIEIEDDDVDTAAGLLTKALGKVPIPGSTAQAHGLTLTAERAEGRRRRLTWLLVERTPAATADADDAESPSEGRNRSSGRSNGRRRSSSDD
ncbi:hemolysin family protein [Demequina sp. TTPB684]|uniref:hemolysin family protein n=1 Tax=unclassified Demequina TaxID=2620311 RepID=UPI001CF3EF5B|nr:hemolysin family protein [Demequina sp. TMPB413]MCB2413310.1 hemolysin family protein [Demequina sp. TTPB684]UPU88970.1 hemolysin family protein [Demequina sp. TMPB413]